jgi:beta-lactamase class A
MNRRPFLNKILCLLAAALLFGAGWYFSDLRHHANAKYRWVKATHFRFTSPLLDVELPEGMRVDREPIQFKPAVEELVKKRIRTGAVQSISVYYRDLQDGPWFGINQDVEFNPASMMKVPVMIAWLKRAEKDPTILTTTTMVFDGKEDLSAPQQIRPKRTIERGKRYTVDELLHYMLGYSDNNATFLLYNALSGKELDDVLDGMDTENHPNETGNSISVHGYSGFFRILYNASYLNREMSEKALELLSEEDFPQGISAGVPKGITVAAKFGEYVEKDKGGAYKQLHEFGIVYHPRSPYILGIMTRGTDFDRQAETIREISSLIYAEVGKTESKGR